MDNGDPPVWLRYDRMPPSQSSVVKVANYVGDAGEDQSKADADNCYDMSGNGCFDVHHPNFGVSFRSKYLSLSPTPGRKLYVNVEYANTMTTDPNADILDVAGKNFYLDYYCFFIGYQISGVKTFNMDDKGRSARIKAVNAYATSYDPTKDPAPTLADECLLDPSVAWNWNKR